MTFVLFYFSCLSPPPLPSSLTAVWPSDFFGIHSGCGLLFSGNILLWRHLAYCNKKSHELSFLIYNKNIYKKSERVIYNKNIYKKSERDWAAGIAILALSQSNQN